MARINTNISALTAQRNLNHAYSSLNDTMQHLSTGLRISSGKDDPAGLIISERLRSEIAAAGQAVSNTQRAGLIVATTEGALDEVASLLADIQAKIVQASNQGAMSDDEIRANQLQIDQSIDSITRIANTASFGGRRLLDGSLQYTASGVATDKIAAYQVHGAQFGTASAIPERVKMMNPAERAARGFPFVALSAPVTIEVSGRLGTTSLSFGTSTTCSQIAEAIAAVKDATGVSAATSGSTALRIGSINYGSKEFARIKILSGGGGLTDGEDSGANAEVTINGTLADASGNHLAVKTSSIDLEMDVADTFAAGSTTTFDITGGGALFQVGPHVNTNLQVNLGVQSVAASNLGDPVVGYLATVKTGGPNSLTNGKFSEASQIVDKAIDQISLLRGRLGSFERGTLDTNANQLNIAIENLTSADSSIRDADFAYETSQLARNQILVSAGTTVLTLANQTTQAVLKLLGG